MTRGGCGGGGGGGHCRSSLTLPVSGLLSGSWRPSTAAALESGVSVSLARRRQAASSAKLSHSATYVSSCTFLATMSIHRGLYVKDPRRV